MGFLLCFCRIGFVRQTKILQDLHLQDLRLQDSHLQDLHLQESAAFQVPPLQDFPPSVYTVRQKRRSVVK